MATPASRSEGQELVLHTNDYNEVALACQSVSARWRDLGTRLGLLPHTMNNMESTHNGNVERCLPAVIEKWLQRPVGEVLKSALPTWKNLCEALHYIDRPLADKIAKEHGCGDITESDTFSEATQPPYDDTVSSLDVASPAFLPQMCGCGKCTVIGWRTGDSCEKPRFSKFPKLLVVDPKYSLGLSFKQDFGRHAGLCKATSGLIDQFNLIVSEIWDQLYDSFETTQVSLSKIIRTLRSGLEVQLPMFPDLDSLQNHCHSLRISWYNFKPLHLLVTRVLANLSSTLLADWNSYLARFREYCSARNLKDLKDVYFRVEEENIFLLEVDDFYDEFTLSDIDKLRTSLGIALSCPSVYLNLVTVGKGSLIIYLYYSYSDYLTVFQSLTTEQLKMISQIKAYRILSLTDLHNQFRYDNIQSYAEALPPSTVKSLVSSEASVTEIDDANNIEKERTVAKLSEEVQMLKKQSFYKDVELTRARKELTSAHKKILEKEEEANELKRELGFFKVDTKRKEEELQELKTQILSNEVKIKAEQKLVAEKTGVQMSKPTVKELDQCLRALVLWERFALHLPGIDQTDIDTIKENSRYDVVDRKLDLYKKWLRVYPDASWDDVIQALEKVEEITIAITMRSKLSVTQTAALPKVTEEVLVKEDLVEELEKLHATFISLFIDVECEIKRKVEQDRSMTLEYLVHSIQDLRAFPTISLQSVTSINDFFKAISPHCNFLDCYLIIHLAMLLSESVAARARKYSAAVKAFSKDTRVKHLYDTLKEFHQKLKTHSINIALENAWGSSSMYLVEELVQQLFPTKNPDEKIQWFEITPG